MPINDLAVSRLIVSTGVNSVNVNKLYEVSHVGHKYKVGVGDLVGDAVGELIGRSVIVGIGVIVGKRVTVDRGDIGGGVCT